MNSRRVCSSGGEDCNQAVVALRSPASSSRIAPADPTSWADLRKGGGNGIFIYLIALTWWKAIVTDNEGLSTLKAVTEDVDWVLSQLTMDTPPKILGKRLAAEAEQPQPPLSKRTRASGPATIDTA